MASKGVAAVEFATEDEVARAVEDLSEPQLARLLRAATLRARALTAYGLGTDGNDLLQEAMVRTLAGTRRWKRGVPFETHLHSTVRSICSHAPGELEPGMVVATAAEHPSAPEAAELLAASGDAARSLAVKEELDEIRRRFEGDDQMLLLIDALGEQMKGPEIQQLLEVTVTQYESLMTRLRRAVDRKKGWR